MRVKWTMCHVLINRIIINNITSICSFIGIVCAWYWYWYCNIGIEFDIGILIFFLLYTQINNMVIRRSSPWKSDTVNTIDTEELNYIIFEKQISVVSNTVTNPSFLLQNGAFAIRKCQRRDTNIPVQTRLVAIEVEILIQIVVRNYTPPPVPAGSHRRPVRPWILI